jgi:acyl-CoA synthetase (AMP-forming)/AMP-acid ligase II
VNCNRLAAQILLRIFDSSLIVVGENVEPLEIEEAAMRSNLIQQIVVIGQVLVWRLWFRNNGMGCFT